jgi:hypothetical protein
LLVAFASQNIQKFTQFRFSSVSELSRASIYGKHWEIELLRSVLARLVQTEAVEWLSSEKTKFKMLFG